MKLESTVQSFPRNSKFKVTLPNRSDGFKDPNVQKQLEFLYRTYSGIEELAKTLETRKINSTLLERLQNSHPALYDQDTLKIIGTPEHGYYLALGKKNESAYCPLGEIHL